jgi:hypothetical protein
MMLITATVLVSAALVAVAGMRLVSLWVKWPASGVAHVIQDAPMVALQHIDND